MKIIFILYHIFITDNLYIFFIIHLLYIEMFRFFFLFNISHDTIIGVNQL